MLLRPSDEVHRRRRHLFPEATGHVRAGFGARMRSSSCHTASASPAIALRLRRQLAYAAGMGSDPRLFSMLMNVVRGVRGGADVAEVNA